LQAGSQLTFRLAAAPVGVYRERIHVHTSAIVGPAQTRDFDEFIEIIYTVTP
jgi:CTP-dependent riboflavin kinase